MVCGAQYSIAEVHSFVIYLSAYFIKATTRKFTQNCCWDTLFTEKRHSIVNATTGNDILWCYSSEKKIHLWKVHINMGNSFRGYKTMQDYSDKNKLRRSCTSWPNFKMGYTKNVSMSPWPIEQYWIKLNWIFNQHSLLISGIVAFPPVMIYSIKMKKVSDMK